MKVKSFLLDFEKELWHVEEMTTEQFQLEPGQLVHYISRDRERMAAFVATVGWDGCTAPDHRPICDLTVLGFRGRIFCAERIKPVFHNGERWIMINRWCLPGELSDSDAPPITPKGSWSPRIDYVSHRDSLAAKPALGRPYPQHHNEETNPATNPSIILPARDYKEGIIP
jgi:hypothetical protein